MPRAVPRCPTVALLQHWQGHSSPVGWVFRHGASIRVTMDQHGSKISVMGVSSSSWGYTEDAGWFIYGLFYRKSHRSMGENWGYQRIFFCFFRRPPHCMRFLAGVCLKWKDLLASRAWQGRAVKAMAIMAPVWEAQVQGLLGYRQIDFRETGGMEAT